MTTPNLKAKEENDVGARPSTLEEREREAMIDEALDESFPASDPPAWTGVRAGIPKHTPR